MVVGQSIIDVQLIEPLIQEQRLDIDISHDRQKCPVCFFWTSLQETTTQGEKLETHTKYPRTLQPFRSTLILDSCCGCGCKTQLYLMEIG